MRYPTLTAVLAVAAALAAPSAIAQSEGSYQTAKLRFTTAQPGAPSGLVFRVDYRDPADPEAKPPAVRMVTERLAAGAAFDTSMPEACTAPDPELMLLGTSACPAGSIVGDGLIVLDTGMPQPGRFVSSSVDFLNNDDELIFLNHVAATETPRVVTRAKVRDRTRVSMAPFLPGTPPDGAAVDTVFARDFVIQGPDGDAYVTTPPTCPRRGYWVNRARFAYADGVEQAVATKNRCRG